MPFYAIFAADLLHFRFLKKFPEGVLSRNADVVGMLEHQTLQRTPGSWG